MAAVKAPSAQEPPEDAEEAALEAEARSRERGAQA